MVGNEQQVRDDQQVRNEVRVRIAKEKAAECIQPAIVKNPMNGLTPIMTAVALMTAGGMVTKFQIPAANQEQCLTLAQDLQQWMQKAIEEAIERWEMNRQEQERELAHREVGETFGV